MKIVILCKWAYPEVAATGVLHQQLAESFCEAGHRVTYVTCFPSFPHGRIYPGYRRRPWQVENRRGVRLVRVWSTFSRRRSLISRLVEQLTYTLSSLVACLFIRADAVIAVSTPLFVGVPGWLCARLSNAPLIFNVMDIFPDTAVNLGYVRRGLAVWAMAALERWIYRQSDRVVVLSEGFRRNLLAKGVPDERIVVLPPWVDTDEVRPLPADNDFAREHGLVGKFVVMHAGNLGLTCGLEKFMAVIARFRDRDDVRFVIIGEGVLREKLERMARKQDLPNLLLLPFQPRERIAEVMSAASVHLVSLAENACDTSVPSKAFTAMAAARPILGFTPLQSTLAEVISKSACGVWAPPDDVERTVVALERLAADPDACFVMGQNGRRFVLANASRHHAHRLLEDCMRILRPASAAAAAGR